MHSKFINLNWLALPLRVCVCVSAQSTAIYSWTDEFAVKTTWKSLFFFVSFSDDFFFSIFRVMCQDIPMNARRTATLWWINIYWIDDFSENKQQITWARFGCVHECVNRNWNFTFPIFCIFFLSTREFVNLESSARNEYVDRKKLKR